MKALWITVTFFVTLVLTLLIAYEPVEPRASIFIPTAKESP